MIEHALDVKARQEGPQRPIRSGGLPLPSPRPHFRAKEYQPKARLAEGAGGGGLLRTSTKIRRSNLWHWARAETAWRSNDRPWKEADQQGAPWVIRVDLGGCCKRCLANTLSSLRRPLRVDTVGWNTCQRYCTSPLYFCHEACECDTCRHGNPEDSSQRASGGGPVLGNQ